MIEVKYISQTDGKEKTVIANNLTTTGFKNGEFGLFNETNAMVFIGKLVNIVSIEAIDKEEYEVSRAEGQGD